MIREWVRAARRAWRGRRDLRDLPALERMAYLELRARGVPPERMGHLELLASPAPEQPASRDNQEPEDREDPKAKQGSQDRQGQQERQDPQVHPGPPPP